MKELLKVLIVDDELGMRLAVERALRNYIVSLNDLDVEVGFTVIQTATGEQALSCVASEHPDIVLLDHKLPGISGIDVLREIQDDNADLLTIMITAYASLGMAIQATKLGAFDFLAKPFTPDELKSALRKASRHFVIQKQARQLAEEKRRIRFQFLTVLAHELKAPLAAIEGYLFILRDRLAGDDPAAYDRIVERSLTRIEGMRKLIFDLLDLTRIESGQKKRELAKIDLAESIQMGIETVLPAANERKIIVTLQTPGSFPLIADRGEIEIIINNLLSNAVKYNRDGGRVDVRVEERGSQLVFSVSDTGIGLTREECARLFGEFVRIKNEKTTHILGSGLGLSIVRRLARLYGGDATVTSKPEVGSTFTVTLERESAPIA
ncbi:MAG: response regulator [Deltaproteobacteria bacterium]|nr:response regulator [Deltaproteobacteria bacterium]